MSDRNTVFLDLISLLPQIILTVVLAAYLSGVIFQYRKQRVWSVWCTGSIVFGIFLLGIAWSPALIHAAHTNLTIHMVQHLLVGMFAPMGLVFAAPITLAMRTLPVGISRKIAVVLHSRFLRWLTHPLIALLLNVGGMYLLYLTPLYSASMENMPIHTLIQIHFLFAGSLFTWVIAGPDPAPHRPGMRTRLGVLFLSMAAHAILGKLMYAYTLPYVDSTAISEGHAAQLMYYGGDFAELLLAITLFVSWYKGRAHLSAA